MDLVVFAIVCARALLLRNCLSCYRSTRHPTRFHWRCRL